MGGAGVLGGATELQLAVTDADRYQKIMIIKTYKYSHCPAGNG